MRLLIASLAVLAFVVWSPGAAAETIDITVRPMDDGCGAAPAPCWEEGVHVVPVGARVALALDRGVSENAHNLRVRAPVDEATPIAQGGSEAPILFDATEAGRIEFVCDIHPDTMAGALVVQHPRVIAGELRADFTLRVVDGARVEVDARSSRAAPDARFLWDFGDGATAEGPTATHMFDGADLAVVTLTVVEPDGASDIARDQVLLSYPDAPRTLRFVAQESGCPGASPCWRGWSVHGERIFAGEWLAVQFENPAGNVDQHGLRVDGGPSTAVQPPGGPVERVALGQATRDLVIVCAVHPEMRVVLPVVGADASEPAAAEATAPIPTRSILLVAVALAAASLAAPKRGT